MPVSIPDFVTKEAQRQVEQALPSDVAIKNFRIEIISMQVEVLGDSANDPGYPQAKSSYTREIATNCSERDITQTATINITDAVTAAWKLACEVSLTEEVNGSINISAPAGSAGGSIGGKVSISVKLTGETSGSSTHTVALTETVQVTTPPSHRSAITGQVWSTPLSGTCRGNVNVRFWQSYTISFPNSSLLFGDWDQESLRNQWQVNIPFDLDYQTEALTFTHVVYSEKVDCEALKQSSGGDWKKAGIYTPTFAPQLLPESAPSPTPPGPGTLVPHEQQPRKDA